MRPHPRIRKTVKWGGAVVSVLLLVTWVGSAWRAVQRNWGVQTAQDFLSGVPNTGGGLVRLGAGEVYFVKVQPPTRMGGVPGWNAEPNVVPFHWIPSIRTQPSTVWVRVPLWIPALLAVWFTVYLWRLDAHARRRAKLGACPKCSYSRAGLAPSAVCPECGSPAPALSASW